MAKKVFGATGFMPTTPPEKGEPMSVRHPTCWLCNSRGLFTDSGKPGFGMVESIDLDQLPQGTHVTFVLHGRYDPTLVIQIEVVLTDGPDFDDAPDGEARCWRMIDILETTGAEWKENGIVFDRILGSVEERLEHHPGRCPAAPFVRPGRFLLFRTHAGETRCIKLPVAHISVQRP